MACQFSLRELLTLVAFAGLGLASLKLGGIVGSLFLVLPILLCMGFTIRAFVDHRHRQAFAIGFIVCVVVYAAPVLSNRERSYDPYDGNPYDSIFPTSRLLLSIYPTFVGERWIDARTGERIRDYDPSQTTSGIARIRIPDLIMFMTIGHTLWAMLFGYAGGKFALLTYNRYLNDKEQHRRPT
jgi:hypothetical protein